MRDAVLWLFVGVAIVLGWRRVGHAILAFLDRRKKYPAVNLARILDSKVRGGMRVSARPLLIWKFFGGRSWALVLFKEGPNEPVAPATKPPFTEPLDD